MSTNLSRMSGGKEKNNKQEGNSKKAYQTIYIYRNFVTVIKLSIFGDNQIKF